MLIKHNSPSLGVEEERATAEVLRSGWLVKGDVSRNFEKRLLSNLQAKSGDILVTSSGTASLVLALKSLNLPPQARVLIPNYVCTAVLNAVLLCNFIPVLCDVSADDFNISKETCEKSFNKDIKAIILVHTFGIPMNVEDFRAFDVPIIEDCCQALGSRFDQEPVGLKGSRSIFSFYASKMITTCFGGAVYAPSKQIVDGMRSLAKYDNFAEQVEVTSALLPMELSDLNASIGIEQLNKLDGFISKRKAIFKVYESVCLEKGLSFLKSQDRRAEANNFRFVLKLGSTELREKMKSRFAASGIATIVPIDQDELLSNFVKDGRSFPQSEFIAKTTLSLPIYPKLIDSGHVENVVNALREC